MNTTTRAALALFLVAAPAHAADKPATGPSFPCDRVEPGSIEALVCGEAGLSALDRRLAEVYAAATAKAANEHPPTLKAEQRGWVKGRDDCWKAEDKRACVEGEYRRRTAELQAKYRLVPMKGPVTFACGGDPRNELIVNFFETDPPTLMAERGDSTSLMFQQAAASGTKYQGRNESFQEHQGEATVVWGWEAPEEKCRRNP